MATAAAMAWPAMPAFAQTGPDTATDNTEIIVTAQKRAERLQDVPISLTVATGEQVDKAGVNNVKDLAQLTVGLNITNTGPQIQPTIRGITSLTGSMGQDNNVAIYVDGVYQATTTGLNMDLVDIKNVQILKGPQGTLFGRNSTAGAILIDTLDPEYETSGRIRASYGRFNDVSVQGYVTAPIAQDVLAINLVGAYRKSDGHLRDFQDRFNPAPLENYQFRGKLLFEPTSDLKFILGGGYSRISDPSAVHYIVPTRNPTAFQNPGLAYAATPGQTSLDRPGVLQFDRYRANLTAELDVGFATLKSITAYVTEDYMSDQDSDGTPIGRSRNLVNSTAKTFTEELNLGGTTGRLDWVLGAFYFTQDNTNTFRAAGTAPNVSTIGTISAPRDTAANPRAWALYADGTYRLTDRLAVVAGIRYSWEKKTFITPFPITTTNPAQASAAQPYLPGGQVSKTWDAFTPRFSLRYEIADNTNIYASFSKGFKSGAYGSTLPTATVNGIPTSIDNPAEPEKATAYEIGIKTAQRNWSFSAAAFYYDYTNLQVQTASFLPPPAPPILASQLTNAASSEIYGLEFNGSVNLTDTFTLSGGLAWTHARYKKFDTAQGFGLCPITTQTINGVTGLWDATGTVFFAPAANLCNDTTVTGAPALPAGFNTRSAGTVDRSGLQMLRSPEWNANISMDWRIPTRAGEFGLNANAKYSSEYGLNDLSPRGIGDRRYRYFQPSYVMINGQISFVPQFNENLKLTIWGRNLADEPVLTSAIGSGGDKYVYGAPRTYGVQVDFKF